MAEGVEMLERRVRRLESTLQPRIPINQMQLSRGSIEGEIQFTRTRGGRFQYQVKDGPGVQSFYAGETLLLGGGTLTGNLLMQGTNQVRFRDKDLTIYSSADGQLDIEADTQLEIDSPTIDIDSATIDLSTQTVDVTLNSAVDALNFASNLLSLDVTNNRIGINEAAPTATLHLVNTEDNANVTILNLEGKRGTPTNNDTMYIYHRMYNDTPASFEYARTTIEAEDITTGSEEGSLLFEVARAGSLETVLKMSATTVVVNEPGADRDFRIEAVGAVNALFVQGSDGNVGFGTATPIQPLDVVSNSSARGIVIRERAAGGSTLDFYNNAGDTRLAFLFVNSAKMAIGTSADRITILAGGNVGVNETNPPSKFAVEGDTRLGDVDTNYVEVEADGDANFVGGAGLQYGEIYTADASDTITIAAAGKANKAQVTSFSANGVSNGSVTPDHTNDHITVGKAGHYFCAVSLHVKSVGGGGADTIGYSVYKNNGATEATNLHGQRDLAGGGGDEGSISLSGIIDCAANDTVELWIWNNDSGDDIVVDDVNLSVIQVGGT